MTHNALVIASRAVLAEMIAAVVWANVSVSKMAKMAHTHWEIKNDAASRKAIRLYREKHPNGPLWRNFRVACWLFGIGALTYVRAGFVLTHDGSAPERQVAVSQAHQGVAMGNADTVLLFAGLIGICAFLIGVLVANIAVFKMQVALNEQAESGSRVSPWLVIGNSSFTYHPVSKYKTQFGDGPLLGLRRFASWLMVPGGVIGFSCLLIEKFR